MPEMPGTHNWRRAPANVPGVRPIHGIRRTPESHVPPPRPAHAVRRGGERGCARATSIVVALFWLLRTVAGKARTRVSKVPPSILLRLRRPRARSPARVPRMSVTCSFFVPYFIYIFLFCFSFGLLFLLQLSAPRSGSTVSNGITSPNETMTFQGGASRAVSMGLICGVA